MATIKQTLKQLTTSRKYYFTTCGSSIYLHKQGVTYPIFHANNENYMKHYLNAMIKCKGIIRINEENIMEMANAIGMIISLYTYGRGSLEAVLNDKYMVNYRVSQDVKRTLAEYVINAICEIKYCSGEDGEGNTYHSCKLVEV
jgi:hypothetical protein